MTIKRRHIGWAVLLSILLIGAYSLYRTSEGIRNAYAVWWVADMVIEHMEANSGEWPAGWDDLRDDYQTCIESSGQPWSFEELSRRVVVDWDTDPQQLLRNAAESETATFHVIRLSDGSSAHWKTLEPNQLILEHLRSQKSESDEQPVRLDNADE